MSITALLPILPVIFLALTAGSITAVRLIRPGFRYFWQIAALGSLFSWLFVLLSRYSLGQVISLSTWLPSEFFPVSPQLSIDIYSWSFALALSTLVLAVILTDTARASEADWASWASNLILTAIGILAVQAGNLLTLVLFWVAIDLTEVLILLGSVNKSSDRESVVIGFSARIGGIILLIGAQLYIYSLGNPPDFSNLPPQANIILIVSALLHLRYIAPNRLLQQLPAVIRNRSYMSYLVTAAGSFILITRTAVEGVPENLITGLLIICGIVGIFASLAWNSTIGRTNGIEFWMLGMASLIVASAVREQAGAALAWGMAALLPGGLLLMTSIRLKFIPIILLFGVLGISTLPYTPAWQGVYLYSSPIDPGLFLILLFQSLFLIGYTRFAFLAEPRAPGLERWVWIIYPSGLVLLLIAHYLLGISNWPTSITLANSLPSVLVAVCSLGLFAFGKKSTDYPVLSRTGRRIGAAISLLFSFEWLFSLLWRGYTVIGKGLMYFIRVIEGDGGVLWGLLFLVLLVTIIAQIGAGM